ncbi:lytic transglycosylase domain-containing protein [Phreatobacter cathodiphilus]|nr:transglycosylase SLT domain-containing protein [Phreatobacter cathodiphilus]
MHGTLRTVLLAGAVLAATPAVAQLDLTPPGARQPPASRPAARPARPPAGAPRVAPLPDPRPAEAAESDATSAPELATVPPAATTPPAEAAPAPAQPAATAAPAAPPSRIDEAFREAEAASRRAPAIPDNHRAVINAQVPPSRTAAAAPPGATPPPSSAEPVAADTAGDLPQLEAPFAEAPPRRFEGRAYSDTRYLVGRKAHYPTVRRLAAALRVPIDLADAVVMVESAYDPHAVGLVDDVGLMQVRPSIARQLGFNGTIQDLFEPETNIRLGVTYLAGAWERSGGNLCQALMKYRAGWDETEMSALSLEYCRRAVVHLNAIGSPLARGVTVPTGSETPPPGQRSTSRFNWQDHEKRIEQIEQRFGGQNFGIIAREPQRP